MKPYLLIILILVFSFVGHGQKFQSDEQDVGFDFATVITIKANIRAEPSTASPVIATFNKDYRLTLLERKPTNEVWFKVSDINSLKRGWVLWNSIQLYYTNPPSISIYNTSPEKLIATQAIKPCNSPKSLPDSYDDGYDRVIYQGNQYWLLDRQPIDRKLKVLNDSNGEIQMVDCSDAQPYYAKTQKVQESPFEKTYSGENVSPPKTTIYNNTDRVLYLYIDGVKYTFGAQERRQMFIAAGTHKYTATASSVRPLYGSDKWENGYLITWEFYIGTVTK